jgi:hypothetical protein
MGAYVETKDTSPSLDEVKTLHHHDQTTSTREPITAAAAKLFAQWTMKSAA